MSLPRLSSILAQSGEELKFEWEKKLVHTISGSPGRIFKQLDETHTGSGPSSAILECDTHIFPGSITKIFPFLVLVR